MNSRTTNLALMSFMSVLIAISNVHAQSNSENSMNFQGRLVQSDGTPLTGSHSAKFEIFEVTAYGNSNSTLVWDQLEALSFQNGFFTTILNNLNSTKIPGRTNVFQADSDKLFELQITVNSTIYPRIPLRAAPTAINSQRLGGNAASDFLKKEDFQANQVIIGETNGPVSLPNGSAGQFLGLELQNSVLRPKWLTVRQHPETTSANVNDVLRIAPNLTAQWTSILSITNGDSAPQGHVLTRTATGIEWQVPQSSNGLPTIVAGSDRGKVLTIDNADQPVWDVVNSLPALPASPNHHFLQAISPTQYQWRPLADSFRAILDTTYGNVASGYNGKFLGVSNGAVGWHTPGNSLPALSTSSNVGRYRLVANNNGSTISNAWVYDKPIFFEGLSTSAIQHPATDQQVAVWNKQNNTSSNELSSSRADDAITVSTDNTTIQFDGKTFPGIYKLSFTMFIGNEVDGFATWKIVKVSGGQTTLKQSVRFAPSTEYPFSGTTRHASIFLRVEGDIVGVRLRVGEFPASPASVSSEDPSYTRVCVTRVGDLP